MGRRGSRRRIPRGIDSLGASCSAVGNRSPRATEKIEESEQSEKATRGQGDKRDRENEENKRLLQMLVVSALSDRSSFLLGAEPWAG